LQSDALELSVTFTNTHYMRSVYPVGSSMDIDDPVWPFGNVTVSYLVVISQPLHILTTRLTFEFTNPGGLPAGGSIAIIDLEDWDSSVSLTGFKDGSEVGVSWDVSYYQTAEEYAPDASWNTLTNTLSGSIAIEDAPSTRNNFTFLVSDVPLDSVVMQVVAQNGDGIGFALSGTSVPNPDPIQGSCCEEVVHFEFLVTNVDSLQSMNVFSFSGPRVLFTDGTPPDDSITIESCAIHDVSPIQIPPLAPVRWCRLSGDENAWWFFEGVPPGEQAPVMGVAFSLPSAVASGSTTLSSTLYDVDYACLAGADGTAVVRGWESRTPPHFPFAGLGHL
jgi:hypothetical protein